MRFSPELLTARCAENNGSSRRYAQRVTEEGLIERVPLCGIMNLGAACQYFDRRDVTVYDPAKQITKGGLLMHNLCQLLSAGRTRLLQGEFFNNHDISDLVMHPRKNLVLVENTEDERMTYLLALETEPSLDVYAARDPEEANYLLETVVPDIVVSDFRMVPMTGGEFLAVVSRRFPDCYRILISGKPRDGVEMPVPPHDFLMKDFSVKDLRERVRKAYLHVPGSMRE